MKQKTLDQALLNLSAKDRWTIRDALMHLLVLGTTGSGKSSSTMKYVITALLKAGFGCLFCIAKPEDVGFIKNRCRETGRGSSVVEITEHSGQFNVLAWQLVRTGNINAVIDLLMQIVTIVRTTGADKGRLGDEFWTSAMVAMLRATIGVIYAATGTVRIGDILAYLRSVPASLEQMKDPVWQAQSAFFMFFGMAAEQLAKGPISGFDDAAAQRAIDYWKELVGVDNKTASGIKITLTTALSRFEQGMLRTMFCGETDVVPELVFHNAILLLNIPVQTYGDDAAIAQKIWKHCVHLVCLARNGLEPLQAQTPVAIIADEAQNFLFNDSDFLAQCRSSLVAVVFATQSIPTIRAKIGGDNPHDRADHLISNFNSVVLHSSACPTTNEWFSKKVGKVMQLRGNYSQGHGSTSNWGSNMTMGRNWGSSSQSGISHTTSSNGGTTGGSNSSFGSSQGGSDGRGRSHGYGSSENVSQGYSEQMDFAFDGGEFGRILKTGGPLHRNRVSALFYQSGRRFSATGTNTMLVEYRQ